MVAGNINKEPETTVSLKGMPNNPGRDPKVMAKQGRGSLGDKAFMDGVIIVGIAWVVLIFLYWSLRHHNV